MNPLVRKLYDLSPVSLQNGWLTAYSAWLHRKRYMGGFPRLRRLFMEGETLSREEMQARRDRKLEEIVSHAYRSVPYYRKLFDRLGLKESDVRCAADLVKLPVLTKHDIKQHFGELISDTVSRRQLARGTRAEPPARLWRCATTGIPFMRRTPLSIGSTAGPVAD